MPSASTPSNRRAADSRSAFRSRVRVIRFLHVQVPACCAARHGGRQPRATPFTGPSHLAPSRAWSTERELVDAIAGFSLFADLTGPQLEGIVHLFEEAVFSEGDKVLRQGLTGSGFYVILDGEAAIVVDGTERARLGRGEFFGEVSIILGESPIADVVATRPLRCLRPAPARASRPS